MTADNASRRVLLDQAAVDVAAAWAHWWMSELRGQGRALAGGWPGTLSEARGWVRAELARKGLNPIVHDELERVARATYARAREAWLACAQGEDEAAPDLEVG